MQLICAEGLTALQRTIDNQFTAKIIACNHCKRTTVNNAFTPGNHVFIDIEALEYKNTWQKCGVKGTDRLQMLTLAQIPTNINIKNEPYRLAGVINYMPNHYQCYARRITGKWELHDGISAKKETIGITTRALLEKRRIHIFYYIKLTN